MIGVIPALRISRPSAAKSPGPWPFGSAKSRPSVMISRILIGAVATATSAMSNRTASSRFGLYASRCGTSSRRLMSAAERRARPWRMRPYTVGKTGVREGTRWKKA